MPSAEARYRVAQFTGASTRCYAEQSQASPLALGGMSVRCKFPLFECHAVIRGPSPFIRRGFNVRIFAAPYTLTEDLKGLDACRRRTTRTHATPIHSFKKKMKQLSSAFAYLKSVASYLSVSRFFYQPITFTTLEVGFCDPGACHDEAGHAREG